jgi:hypothetical protein
VPGPDAESRHPQYPHPLCADRTVSAGCLKGFLQSIPDPFSFFSFRGYERRTYGAA